jgi:hypothetical protein
VRSAYRSGNISPDAKMRDIIGTVIKAPEGASPATPDRVITPNFANDMVKVQFYGTFSYSLYKPSFAQNSAPKRSG